MESHKDCRKSKWIVWSMRFLLLATLLSVVLPVRGQASNPLAQSGLHGGVSRSKTGPDDLQRCVDGAMVVLANHSVQVTSREMMQRAASTEGSIERSYPPQTTDELERMYEIFVEAAHRGDAAAQINVAMASLAGWGTEQNAGAALFWLNEAARQGSPLAYFDLGVLYQNGCGVRQDYSEAARYFKLGAQTNHAPSQVDLGYLYDQGLGVARDQAQAAAWYRRAAEQGLAQAQFNLADLLVRGEGLRRDEAAALSWFQKAARQGHTTAQLMLAAMYAQGRGTVRDLRLAYEWLTLARLAGDVRAEVQLQPIEARLSAAEIAEARAQALRLLQPSSAATTVVVLR